MSGAKKAAKFIGQPWFMVYGSEMVPCMVGEEEEEEDLVVVSII